MAPAVSQSLGSILTGSCLSSRCFKINKWVHFTCGPRAFQSGAFALVWGSSEFDHGPFKRGFSIPCSAIVFLDIFPIGFQSQVFWGLLSPVQDVGVGVPDVELEPLAPQGKDLYLCDPSRCGLPQRGCGCFLWQDCLSASPMGLRAVLLTFVVEALLIQFSGLFSEGIIPHIVADFLCQWED